jgi:hypothetical protein
MPEDACNIVEECKRIDKHASRRAWYMYATSVEPASGLIKGRVMGRQRCITMIEKKQKRRALTLRINASMAPLAAMSCRTWSGACLR